jgi:methyl-accepting chemotaxis protein
MASKRKTAGAAVAPKSAKAAPAAALDPAELLGLRAHVAALSKAFTVLECQPDGTIITANENFLRLTGYELGELQGQHHDILVDAPESELWEKLAAGEFESRRFKRLAKGGAELWVRGSYSPVFDAAGNVSRIIAYVADITEHVQAEEVRLRQLEEQTRVSQQMAQSVVKTQEIIRAATEGDLTRRLDVTGQSGDLMKLGNAINTLLESVSDIVSGVKNAAAEVLRGAEEISQGNANLSQRTEEQSSSLEETASSMEEMTSTVKQNADNAGQANQLATAARDQAEKGGAVVGSAVKAMADINESSKKISDIIGVIDEIAFQTNLLALNAAVEAARAGEQGRGFAVVATEVRSLAGRSATAAKEIKELIQDSVRKVGDGSLLVTQSGQTLEQIVMSVKKVSDIVAEIAAASREQSSGIEQVNKAVMQMDEMTQQNAALVEQATAASQSMADQARDLTVMMEKYQVNDSGVSVGRAPASPKAQVQSLPERRGANRPFSGKPAVAPGKAPVSREVPVAPSRAVANGNDADWREF